MHVNKYRSYYVRDKNTCRPTEGEIHTSCNSYSSPEDLKRLEAGSCGCSNGISKITFQFRFKSMALTASEIRC